MRLSTATPCPARPALQTRPTGLGAAFAPPPRGGPLHSAATLARWVEVDETANLLLGEGHDGFIQGLSALDGLVTAYDGWHTFREGTREQADWKIAGGVVRMGLGLAGMAPGLTGNAFEAACGVYCSVEGLQHHDKLGAVGGLTQLGVSVGAGAASLGVGGPVGPALVVGCGLARIAYYLHHLEEMK